MIAITRITMVTWIMVMMMLFNKSSKQSLRAKSNPSRHREPDFREGKPTQTVPVKTVMMMTIIYTTH